MNDASMEISSIEEGAFNKYKLSWVTYFRPLVFTVFLLAVVYAFSLSAMDWYFLTGAVALITMNLIYRVLLLRSVVLFVNDQGVWVYKGIFPWNRGTAGVRWRDVEDASYVPGFIGWVLKAYKIRIGHRFTRGSEIVLASVKNGHEAVEQINGLHSDYLLNNNGVQ